MGTGIYLIRDDGQLVEMSEQPYDSEDLLQELLATYPNLLAGDQMSSASPRRWLLISREAPVPAEDGGSARWSVDHLFFDQDGIPTLVEVKRSTDTRIRREVVGQMLDYAANAVVYWPLESLRATFEARHTAAGADATQAIAAALGRDDPDALWEQVKTNLAAGRVRMVFVADVIPPELLRIVEFLNGQMTPAEVLAVEIRQYIGQGQRTLIPRLLGQTAAAEKTKGTAQGSQRRWDEASFFDELATRRPHEETLIARRIYEWTREHLDRLWWGRGKYDGSCYGMLDLGALSSSFVALWTSGSIEIPFQYMRMSPFTETTSRAELLARLNAIPGVNISANKLNGSPTIRLSVFANEPSLQQLFTIFGWALEQIRASWSADEQGPQ